MDGQADKVSYKAKLSNNKKNIKKSCNFSTHKIFMSFMS